MVAICFIALSTIPLYAYFDVSVASAAILAVEVSREMKLFQKYKSCPGTRIVSAASKRRQVDYPRTTRTRGHFCLRFDAKG